MNWQGGRGWQSVAEPVRRAALLGGAAAVLFGCGGQTKTVTAVTSAPSLTAAPSIVTAGSPVAGTVVARVKRSVLPISCDIASGPAGDPNAPPSLVGTGFRVRNGVVTASHVVAACPPGTPLSPGDGAGTVSTDDRTRDLALLTYQGPDFPDNRSDPNLGPLRPESKPAYVGEPLVLLGVPVLPVFGNPFTRQVAVVPGHVIATNQTQQFTPLDAAPEILKGAIEVAAPGVVPGESGGPAIDAAGQVVGVIVGSSPGVATLTPVAGLATLH